MSRDSRSWSRNSWHKFTAGTVPSEPPEPPLRLRSTHTVTPTATNTTKQMKNMIHPFLRFHRDGGLGRGMGVGDGGMGG